MADMKNSDIKDAAKTAGVKLWQIAEAYGMQDSNFSRKLRRELPEAEKKEILAIIDRLTRENQGVE